MKSRTKSTKTSLINEGKKSKNKINQSKITKSLSKKSESQLRSNLESTLRLLESRLHLKPSTSNATMLSLSANIFKIVQQKIPEKTKVSVGPTLNSFNSSGVDLKEKNTNKESCHPKRSHSNHSSSLMEYFKDKFGSPATDEQSLEKKMKALQILKRSQELVSKCSSHYNSSMHSGIDLGCDIGGKEVVMGKLKEKRQQKEKH